MEPTGACAGRRGRACAGPLARAHGGRSSIGLPLASHAERALRRAQPLEGRRVLPEDVLHRSADLADRGAVLQRLADRRQQILLSAGDLVQLLEARLEHTLVWGV